MTSKKKNKKKKNPHKVSNIDLYKAMMEIRRSNAATPIPYGKYKGSKSNKNIRLLKIHLIVIKGMLS